MSVVFKDPEIIAEYVGRIGGKPFRPPYTAIGVYDRSGIIYGGFVFTGFNGDGIELSVAGRGIACRTAWRAVVDYVFDQLGCQRLQMHTRRSNRRVTQILPRFGMKFEGIARRFYGQEDGVTYSLTVDDLPGFMSRWRL